MCITNEVIETMKGRMIDELELTAERLNTLQKDLKDLPENDPDPLDVAQKMEQRESIVAESQRLNNRSNQVRKALNLIREGEYGFCQSCGEDMDINRLNFDPASLQCVDCKTISESSYRRMGARV